MKISFIARILKSYKIFYSRFGRYFSPLITGIFIFILRVIVFVGMFFDLIFIPSLHKKKIKDPIVIVGNPRSGTTFLQRFLVKNNFGVGLQLWQMIYPSVILQKLIKPFLPILEYISPAKHHSTEAHKTSLQSIETDDVGIFFRYLDGFFLYGFILCWAEEDLFNWVDPKIRDNSKRDFRWLNSIWKRSLFTSDHNKVIGKLFSLSSNTPAFIANYPGAKILYMVRDPLKVIPSGLSLVTGVLDKKFGFWNQPKKYRDRFIKRLYRGLVELQNRFCVDWNSGAIKKENVFIVKFDKMMNNFDELMNDLMIFIGHEADDALRNTIMKTSNKQKEFKSKHLYDLEKFGLTEDIIRKDCEQVYKTFLY